MGTVFENLNGFNLLIYPHDHDPPHVHCWKGGGVVIFFLNGRDGKSPGVVEMREVRKLKPQEVKIARAWVQAKHTELLERWEERNGK